ncbi:hypothetical protein LWI29_006698 [Acer saccharum]|uniref:hAT-like transposase RNase-H fold domain-containing protein n=1 Tax=Acer saccharum TaxID=4024 RepID=A0AA39S2Y1_ACESA|nr:hypothetical protein LWI29_006698 [Acer saccharum]
MDPDNLDVEDIHYESMEEDYDGGETQVDEVKDLGKGKENVLEKKPHRQRKSTSKVWSVFVKLPRGKDGKLHYKCKMCGKTYRCESCYGTALVLDPRYKMTFVEFAYKKVYGFESVEIENVQNKLFSLFNEYMMHSTRRVTSNSLPNGSSSRESENITTSSMHATISYLDLLEVID